MDQFGDVLEATVSASVSSNRGSNQSMVLLRPESMQAKGMFAGDVVQIYTVDNHGTGPTAFASVWPLSSAGEEVWLPETVLLNCQANIGDRVHVKRISYEPTTALSIRIRCPGKRNGLDSYTESLAKKRLSDIKFVYPGQYIDISIRGMPCRVCIESLRLQKDKRRASEGECARFLFEATSVSTIPVGVQEPDALALDQLHLDSVGGLADEIKAISLLVDASLKRPETYTQYHLNPPRGVLLYGPPGTGKTLVARSVAKSSDFFFTTINGAEITNKYYGENEKMISSIVKEAQENSPSIIFIDEIDALCPKRDGSDSEADKRIVATLLTLMDGAQTAGLDRVFFIGATNRPNSIDPALRRPGRFDQEIEIPIPDKQARLSILSKKLGRVPNSLSEEQRAALAAELHGFVGADIEALVREAGIHAIRAFNTEEARAKAAGKTIRSDALHIGYEDFQHALKVVRPSSMREIMLEIPNVSWDDIGGQQDTKNQLKEAVDWPLNHPEAFRRLGIRPPKGVLLYGPPGCSKTLTAKALATEAKVNFIAVRGPELFSKWVGESEKAVRDLFRKARAAAPSIVFFDEIDALTVSRGSSGDGTSVADRVLSQLLTELDGIEPLVEVTVVAATNMLENIDPAILRPGRIDRKIYVGLPDESTRKSIFDIQFRRMACDPSVNVDELVKKTDGFSGAEVVSLCQEAGMAAISDDPEAICVEMKHFLRCLKEFRSRVSPEALELLRATGAGQVVGRLRNYEGADIAVLAKKVVHKWKKDVVAANSRASGASGLSTKTVSRSSTPQKGLGQTTKDDQQKKSEGSNGSDHPVRTTPADAQKPSNGSSAPVSSDGHQEPDTGASSSKMKSMSVQPGNNPPTSTTPVSSGGAAGSDGSALRTAASDKTSLPKTGDSVRDKCIELLYNSMALDSTASSQDLAERAEGIELIEFNKAGSVSTTYRARIRSLCFNLKDKKNPELCFNVVNGVIPIERFCSMTSEEMASDELKEIIERIKEENLFKAKGAKRVEAETNQFKCSRCGKRRCSFYQMQTRSADEPMTTFVTCLACDHRWKFS
ncbi:AAA+-type ATPase [Coemansia sp. Benny D160-2]|nr:AAA+-type ATPase [Coemansia sp. Benny D160-2]